MKYRNSSKMTVLFALVVLAAVCSGAMAQELYKAPDPGIPELYTITGQYVRIAYNNEGYVSLGYRLANRSVDEEWMLLQFGVTVRDGVDNQKLKREALSIETPDGKTIPLATMKEYNGAPLRGLENQAKVVSDSINYFPGSAYQGCRIGFFARTESRLRAWDELELSSQRACVGRVFFNVPGGIQYGQHWLNVQFKDSLVKVPFRILTKEEQEKFKDSWQDVKKEHEKKFFKN